MNTTRTGQDAESAVAAELINRGFKIIARNWKTPFAEIDIIASRNGTLYFVEVKYRRSLAAGDGFDYITKNKLRHMTRAAEAWVSQNSWNGGYELMAAAVIGFEDSYEIDIRQLV